VLFVVYFIYHAQEGTEMVNFLRSKYWGECFHVRETAASVELRKLHNVELNLYYSSDIVGQMKKMD
jgi:hypothetical protein